MASNSGSDQIHIPIWLWATLVFDLRRRGEGRRESGAFLLGRRENGAAKVGRYLCYDDVDPVAYQHGAIAFHASGYAALWTFCRKHGVELIADAHTHPGKSVAQSPVDQRHPMVPVVGHTAMILPYFARTRWWSLKGVGIYEYLGSFKWRSHPPEHGELRVRLTLW